MPDTTYLTIGNNMKKLMDIGGNTFAEVVALPNAGPAIWLPSNSFNAQIYSDVEIQIVGTPSTAYIFQDCLDGINFNDCNAVDKNGMLIAAVATAGRFRLPGNCFLKARQGAGSTIYIRAGS